MADSWSVDDLSDRYANFMRLPAPAGPGVCEVCRTWIDDIYTRCYHCNGRTNWFSAVAPITYSLELGQMHTALRGYKDGWGGDHSDRLRNQFTVELAAVLARFLQQHEGCVARAAGVKSFDLVTTVPSGTAQRDNDHWRLRWIADEGCGITAPRYRRILRPTSQAAQGKLYDPARYQATEQLSGQSVLVIDDTWTQGRSAQSAGAALHAAGGGRCALVVLGRHIVPTWQVQRGGVSVTHSQLLASQAPWSWDTCALHP